MKRKVISGIVLMLLLTSMLSSAFNTQPVKAENGLTESPWPMFQHDPQRTGMSEYAGPQHAEVSWISDVGTPVPLYTLGSSLQPVIGLDGVIYFGTGVVGESGKLYAFNSDGTIRWQSANLEGYPGTPAVSPDGTIFVGTSIGVVYALNTDGTEKWKFYCEGNGAVLAITLGSDGTLYFASGYRLYALNPDGTEKWYYEHKGYVQHGFATAPAVSADGTIYAVYPGWWTGTDQDHGVLHALNPDGTRKWLKPLDGFRMSAPSVGSDGTVYVAGAGVHAFHPNGTLKWKALLAPSIGKWFSRHWITIGPDGVLIAGGSGSLLSIIRAFSPEGDVLWSFEPEEEHSNIVFGSIVDAEGTVFVQWHIYGWDSRIYSINSAGIVKWAFDVPGFWLYSSWPAIGANGHLYIASAFPEGDQLQQAKLYSFGPAVQVNQPPIATFTYTPHNPIVGEQITFDASDSYDPDGETVSYEWNFGDSCTAEGRIVTHSYSAEGYYTVTLTATDNDGATDSISKIVVVATTVPNEPPVAFFTHSPESPKAGEETKLDASESFDPDPDGEIKFYEWDLDGDEEYDGFTTSPVIYYYWDKSGTYSVKLRVIDDGGATDTFIKDVNVQQRSLWEKAKKLFASSVKTLTASEKRRFEIIKSELRIINYPHSDNPSSDPDFYWISDNQLLFVLKKKIEPEAGDLTYETLIIDILHDMKLADSVANRPWTVNPEIEKYFQNMAEINVWAEVAMIMLEMLLEGIIEAGGGSGIGVGSVLMLWDLCQAGVELKLLDKTFYRRALWHYFQLRGMDYSPEVAFESAPIPPKYDNVATREYFESLWTEYGGPHISESGGLKQDFQEQVIKQLRTVLLSGLEKYKFEPYHLYRLKSPGELQVYDSQGRVTGLVNGEAREEIPNSAYDDESKTIIIFPATDSYHCQVVGTDKGTYELTVTSVEDGKATSFSATDIPTSVSVIHQYTIDWETLSLGEEGVTVQIDSDGDAMFEHIFASDSELSLSEYVAAMHAINIWITNSDFNEIESFRAVFTPYGNTEVYELTATNPGQFYFNILINNTWQEPLNMTIVYLIDTDFTLKGAKPIHVYADLERTIDVTANCTFSDNTITVYNVAPNAIIYVTIHLDYALKGTTWTMEEVEAWHSEHGFSATVRSITSEVLITDPELQIPPLPLSLIFLMGLLPAIILCLGIFIALLKYALLPTKRRK